MPVNEDPHPDDPHNRQTHPRDGVRDHQPDRGRRRTEQIAAWSRGHWMIENRLHWVRDVDYDEDRSRVPTGFGPQVMATLRNTAC